MVSALQKEIRRGNEDKCIFWALELVESGNAQYMWTRLAVMVGEEIGLADPIAYAMISDMYNLFAMRAGQSHLNGD